MKRVSPMQVRGPSPNGTNAFGLYLGLSPENRSGKNCSGSGKYSGSRMSPRCDITIGVPFLMIKSEFGIGYSWVHTRLRKGNVGYFRSVSKQNNNSKQYLMNSNIRKAGDSINYTEKVTQNTILTQNAMLQKHHFIDVLIGNDVVVFFHHLVNVTLSSLHQFGITGHFE